MAANPDEDDSLLDEILGSESASCSMIEGRLVEHKENGLPIRNKGPLLRVVGVGKKAWNAAKARAGRVGGVSPRELLGAERAARTETAELQGMLTERTASSVTA